MDILCPNCKTVMSLCMTFECYSCGKCGLSGPNNDADGKLIGAISDAVHNNFAATKFTLDNLEWVFYKGVLYARYNSDLDGWTGWEVISRDPVKLMAEIRSLNHSETLVDFRTTGIPCVETTPKPPSNDHKKLRL